MKKLTALLMAFAMAASMAVTAFAAFDGINVDTDKNGVALEGALLTPGETYEFPVKISNDTVFGDLKTSDLDSVKTEVRITSGGANIESARIMETDAGQYALVIKVKAGWPTTQTSAGIKLRLVDKTTYKELGTKEFSFKTGYATMDSAYVDGLTADEAVVIDSAKPVITKAQLEKIAKLNSYKSVTFKTGECSFTVNVTDMDSINMLYKTEAVKDIITMFPDQQFKFATFPAGPQFSKNGKVEIDVSSEYSDFNGKFFVYRYADGKLYKIASALDQGTSTISFTTNKLGRFVITDKEIKDATVVVENAGGTINKNPNTGANDFVGAAAALAVLSLAAAGAVALRKQAK